MTLIAEAAVDFPDVGANVGANRGVVTAGLATLAGPGLFRGQICTVRLVRRDGPLSFADGERELPVESLTAGADGRTSALFGANFRVSCVEHLFAALAAMGVRDGLRIEIDADELPLLDGGARKWMAALAELRLRPSVPALRVVAAGEVSVAGARYCFEPVQPGETADPHVEVEIDGSDPRLTRFAAWAGDEVDFFERIALARTFARVTEIDWMLAQGMQANVEPTSVVLIGESEILCAGRPFAADEPARHKLLDFVGDLGLHGGPPSGRVRAIQPNHAATHTAVERALSEGLLRRELRREA
jgi:UDP-3-O-[3-hydroxymyristoyl] N-acetylglucosamine deacetylase